MSDRLWFQKPVTVFHFHNSYGPKILIQNFQFFYWHSKPQNNLVFIFWTCFSVINLMLEAWSTHQAITAGAVSLRRTITVASSVDYNCHSDKNFLQEGLWNPWSSNWCFSSFDVKIQKEFRNIWFCWDWLLRTALDESLSRDGRL